MRAEPCGSGMAFVISSLRGSPAPSLASRVSPRPHPSAAATPPQYPPSLYPSPLTRVPLILASIRARLHAERIKFHISPRLPLRRRRCRRRRRPTLPRFAIARILRNLEI